VRAGARIGGSLQRDVAGQRGVVRDVDLDRHGRRLRGQLRFEVVLEERVVGELHVAAGRRRIEHLRDLLPRVIARTEPMPVPAGNTFVSDVSMPSYVSVLPDAAAARTMRWSRRAQPELTSM
jgi:hypothetical protein